MAFRTSLSLSITSVLVGLSILVPATPAAAACTGAGCNGKMAAAEGCTTGAYAIVGFTLADDEVSRQTSGDLWYSPTCRAMWGDFNAPEVTSVVWGQLWTQPEYGGVNHLAASNQLSQPGNWTTPMVDWQQSVKFCGTHKGTDPDMDLPSQGYNACTAWR